MPENICNQCLGTGKRVNQKTFGKAARLARQHDQLRQDHMAKAMGISKTYLCYLEQGKKNWTLQLHRNWQRAIDKLNLKKSKQS